MGLSRKLQELVETISNDRNNLLNSVSGLNESQFGFRASDDQWSIGDILHHLALSDEANVSLFSILRKKAAEGDVEKDPSPEATELNCLDSIKKFEGSKASAPARVNPRSDLPTAEALDRLAGARERLLENVKSLDGYDLGQLGFPHPMFGEMNGYQWLLLAGWHERRHTSQIERIKSTSGFPGD